MCMVMGPVSVVVELQVWNGALVKKWKSTIVTFDIDVSVDNAIIRG